VDISLIYRRIGGINVNKLFNNHPLVLDKHLAAILGLNEALILQQVHYWIEINRKNNRNLHRDRYWTYNTINEWQEEFPFWSPATVKRTFKRLREVNLIIVDNFNIYQMDRTLWYTINYEELERLIKHSEITTNKTETREGQNDVMKRSDSTHDNIENEPMDKSNMTSPLPETSTEISANVYNQSVNQSSKANRERERWTSSSDEFERNYTRIIEKCELISIDEKYREAVAHGIKLLLLDIENSRRIKIGDNYIPAEMAMKDLDKLDFFAIEHAVNKFKEASVRTEIRNTISYLKTCIYNSIGEMKIELESKLRYKGYT